MQTITTAALHWQYLKTEHTYWTSLVYRLQYIFSFSVKLHLLKLFGMNLKIMKILLAMFVLLTIVYQCLGFIAKNCCPNQKSKDSSNFFFAKTSSKCYTGPPSCFNNLYNILTEKFKYIYNTFVLACKHFGEWLKILAYNILCIIEKGISKAKVYVKPDEIDTNVCKPDLPKKQNSCTILTIVGNILLIPGIITLLTIAGFLLCENYEVQVSDLMDYFYLGMDLK